VLNSGEALQKLTSRAYLLTCENLESMYSVNPPGPPHTSRKVNGLLSEQADGVGVRPSNSSRFASFMAERLMKQPLPRLSNGLDFSRARKKSASDSDSKADLACKS
jgi:hypothetical protein